MKPVSLLLLVFALLVLGAPQAASAYQAGSYYKSELSTAKKKCKKKKGKAKRACSKKAAQKASKATLQKMKGGGVYGFSLKTSDIPSKPGTLVWSKSLPRTQGASRTDLLLYSSRAYPSGKKIVVSGTLSTPPGKGPWPVISWAHGTTGLGDGCAPSLGKDGGSYGGAEPLIAEWLRAGYAVAATDYEGLGTPGPHPYLVGESEGRGVVDIVPAARSLRPLRNSTWIAGHSQGAHAALFAARADRKKPFQHLGTIAYAPPAFLDVQAQSIATQPADAFGIAALASAILRGTTIQNPAINPEDLLTAEALELYPLSGQLCLSELSARFQEKNLGPPALLRPDWRTSPSGNIFIEALQAMQPDEPLDRKLLLLQGFEDTTVLQFLTRALFFDLSASSPGLVQYKTYGTNQSASNPTESASTHSSILGDSLFEVQSFLTQR